MEASEVDEFRKEVQEAGEHSMTHVALIISVLAVFVALVTVLGHREHTEAVLQQARASDQWSEYQAHKIRALQLTIGSDILSHQSSPDSAGVSAYKSQAAHLAADFDEDQNKAKEYEAEVDKAERKAAKFDLGEALLEIAVVLASITLLTRKSIYVVGALALGAVGLLTACWGFVLH